jgi:peptide/nickel transport system permease protein
MGAAMPLDRRSLRIIGFRAVTLSVTLIFVLIMTAIIVGATGYDRVILSAIIEEAVNRYREALLRPGSGLSMEEVERLVAEYREYLIRAYGLDKPWYQRSLSLIPKVIVLDLHVRRAEVAGVVGLSPPVKVGDVIAVALPRTIVMITIAYIISALIAIPLGPFIAYRRGSILDKAVITYAAITNAFPVWWIAMLAIALAGFYLGVAPTSYRPIAKLISDFTSNLLSLDVAGLTVVFKDLLYYSYLPILVVTFATLGGWLYSARAVAIRVVSEDYVMAAKARGLSEGRVVRRYVMRVIAGPILTFVILGLAGSIGGYIITETVFDWPGMGLLYYTSIVAGDSPMILALVYVTTLVYIAARFILEVLYVILDPRVKL